MTSVNFYLRPSVRVGRYPGRLYIRVIRARQSRHISTDYALYPDEWDNHARKIIFPRDAATDHNRFNRLSLIDESMANDLKRLKEIISLLSENGDYTAADVVKWFSASLSRDMLCGYAEVTGKMLREQGNERTARAYRSAVRSFVDFNKGSDIPLSNISAPLIKSYEQYLIGKGLKMNTVSFYLRNLRALYFRAVSESLIVRQGYNPFAGTHTGVYETKRRALDNQQLKALAKLENLFTGTLDTDDIIPDTEEYNKMSALRDSLLYFMFCYHARGMSFVDMATLRKEDIGKDSFLYKRRKTGSALEIKITKPMKNILSYFESKTKYSEYAFPIIHPSGGNIRRQYETGLKKQNRSLKTLAKMANIEGNISTHVARHTWATLAKRLNVPIAVIGEALGHRDVKTTSIYLASFDRTTMDELSVRMSKVAKAM